MFTELFVLAATMKHPVVFVVVPVIVLFDPQSAGAGS
jgi:hypothetical protein